MSVLNKEAIAASNDSQGSRGIMGIPKTIWILMYSLLTYLQTLRTPQPLCDV